MLLDTLLPENKPFIHPNPAKRMTAWAHRCIDYGLMLLVVWALSVLPVMAAQHASQQSQGVFPQEELCKLFPTAAQTWAPKSAFSSRKLDIGLDAFVESGNGFRVGFPLKKNITGKGMCAVRVGETDTGEPIFEKQPCQSDEESAGEEPFTLTEKPNFEDGFSGTNKVDLVGGQTLRPGQYGEVTIQLYDNQSVHFESGTYWIKTLNINFSGHTFSSVTFDQDAPTILNVNRMRVLNHVYFNPDGESRNVLIKGNNHTIAAGTVNPAEIAMGWRTHSNVLIMSESVVYLATETHIHGAVTAGNIGMTSKSSIQGWSECAQPSKEYSIEVESIRSTALMCGNDVPEFLITTKENDAPTSLEVQANVSPNPENFTFKVLDGKGSESGGKLFSNEQGQLGLQVLAKEISQVDLSQVYQLTLAMAADPAKTQTVKFRFVPFALEAYNLNTNQAISEVEVIAGRGETVPVRMMACQDADGSAVATNYSGKPAMNYDVVIPSGGLKGQLTFAPDLAQGVDIDPILRSTESGQFDVTLTDSFSCQMYRSCPENGQVSVTGSLTVKSRPWTLAVCDDDDDTTPPLQSGTSEGGSAFIASGDSFNLKVRPIRWQAKGSASDPIETSGYCEVPITQNFFHANAPQASVELSSEVHTPSNALGNASIAGDQGLSRDHHQDAKGSGNGRHWLFTNLSWSDVGSLKVTASTNPSSYLGQTINPGYRNIGRFYPKYFKVTETEWDFWGENELPFTYMDQPFDGVAFSVRALNLQGGDVANYSQFANNLKAQFNLAELGGYTVRFRSPVFADGHWQTSGGASIGTFEHTNSDVCGDNITLCWQKGRGDQYPDGPFNTGQSSGDVSQIGLSAKSSVDPIEYREGENLLTQPDIRFGRAALTSVGGTVGQAINVPLQVQFWQQGRFRTNQDDSHTQLDGKHFCYDVQWPSDNDTTSAVLENRAQVLLGQSRQLQARQTAANPIRESIEFFLTLGEPNSTLNCSSGNGANSNLQPWLKYDWDGNNPSNALDEEDPSAVVTFGIYRGNDRVIYRGEAGILGQ